ncbi:hypothetical protein QE152_g15678 [Popillia japonica]|uniref:Uncharacterized protein n=1 Tax=Popillia japonica TaxID=7064 RepID=A0AAW1L893_POPJA
MVKRLKELIEDINFIFKLVECICCVATCIAVFNSSNVFYEKNLRDLLLDVAAGYIIMIACLFVLYIFEGTNTMIEMIILASGVAVNILAGSLCLVQFDDDNKVKMNYFIVAAFTFTTGIVMLADFGFLIKNKRV